jgi:hypothetical protein
MHKPLIPTTAMLASLALGGCVNSGPDFAPIGDGLKAIGVALVAFGVVGALADLIRSGEKPTDRPKPDKSPGSTPEEGS